MQHKIQRYGWIPDLPDQRDHLYAAPIPALKQLPDCIDLSLSCPPVYDQGQLGSCTANAIGAALQFDELQQHVGQAALPSRLFIYYNERSIEGTVATDSGAQIRDGIKSVAKQGACPESLWPYEIANFSERPPQHCYQVALNYRAILYRRMVQNLMQMKICLASGYPFIFGFTVYTSFETPQTAASGQIPLPSADEQIIGGHAMLAVGYNDATQRFLARNSWGASWGLNGYCTLPYTYLLTANLAADFWMIQSVQNGEQPPRNKTS